MLARLRQLAPAGSCRRAALGLAAVAFAVYNLNLRVIPSGDTRSSRYLPLALWRHGSLTLEGFEPQVTAGLGGQYWTMRTPSGRLASQYPVVAPLLASPLYLPAVALLTAVDWRDDWVGFVAAAMERSQRRPSPPPPPACSCSCWGGACRDEMPASWRSPIPSAPAPGR